MSFLKRLTSKLPGGPYVAAIMTANILNFVFSLFLSRSLNFEQYGLLTLLNTFWLIAGIFITSLLQTINHRTAYLATHHNGATATAFVLKARRLVAGAGILACVLWLACIPVLESFFKLSSILPLLLFTPVIIVGCLASVEKGFLQGSLAFRLLALTTILEPLSKTVIALVLVLLGYKDVAYISITLSVILSLAVATIFSSRIKSTETNSEIATAFPNKFMLATIATTLASTAFITVDVLMAKHYLSPTQAGVYANLSLVGKMIFYFGSIFNTLMITFVSRAQGQSKPTGGVFSRLLTFTLLASGATAATLGLFGHVLVPAVFGPQASVIIDYLPRYAWAMVAFTLSTAIVAYHLAKQRYTLPIISTIFTLVLGAGIMLHHNGIKDIVNMIAFASLSQFIVLSMLHLWGTKRQAAISKAHAALDSPVSYARLRILHLGFEDFRRPGSGGGAIRTHEINKRIIKHHDITVLVSKYKGSVDRVEDGVRYVHIGLPLGYFGSILTYFAVLPFAAHKYHADLVVEDFAAPFSSCLSPLWNRRRSIAMVQWLNAREKSKQYHLPFWIIEKLGTRLHRNYIAVSADLASKIRYMNPRASVEVVANGVPHEAFDEPLRQARKDIVFVGRLERAQKGLDLLLDAYVKIADKTNAKLILVGSGPDVTWVRSRISALNLTTRVVLTGRIDGQHKHALLATAKVVAMPSRFETFGMVAIEALAAGAPVVAFDIPCLREVIPEGLGVVVPTFDVAALANALLKNLTAGPNHTAEDKRRTFAAAYDWDALADQQRAIYERSASDMFVSGNRSEVNSVSQNALECLFAELARRHGRRNHRTTVALVGNYGNGNTGDEAILAGIYEMASPYVDLRVLARDEKLIRKLHNINALDRKSLRGIKALIGCDVLAIGGGGLFGIGMPRLVRILPIIGFLFALLGKDVIFVAIGADPAMPRTTARILRWLAHLSYAVTTRDAKTAAFLSEGRKESTKAKIPIVVDDPAITLKPASHKEVMTTLCRSQNDKRLMISLKPTPSDDTNARAVSIAAEAADKWIERTGGGVDFLCLSSVGDFSYGMKITDKTMSTQAKRLSKYPQHIDIVGPDLKPHVAKGFVASSAGVLGSRLHALIFAHATHVPVFGLTFEAKSRTFLESIGERYSDIASISSNDLDTWLGAVETSQSRSSAS